MNSGDTYILYLGGIFTEDTVLYRSAVSPAANRWQKGLLDALKEHIPLRTLGHLPEPLWPKGQWRIQRTDAVLLPAVYGRTIAYLNIPYLRSSSLEGGYRRALRFLCEEHGAPSFIMSYNLYPHTITVAREARERYGIPWICIVADTPSPGKEKDLHDAMLGEAAGLIYLSWTGYETAVKQPALHLDGGISEVKFTHGILPQTGEKRAVLYTGVLDHFGGVNLLVEAFKHVKDPDTELWICGKGGNAALQKAISEDQRIQFFGTVTEQRLAELSRAATVFVNPRPSSVPENAQNFPSKILEYLSYGNPVISTWTGGLSGEYRRVLTVLKEETPGCIAQTIEEVLGWDDERRLAAANAAHEFLVNKQWSRQAERVIEWLGQIEASRSSGNNHNIQ